MQIAQVIGGYSLGGADLLRRAMGKKKPEEMAKHRDIFVEGARRTGIRAQGDELFDLMEKFAGYGFNKSHAAAYALVAYQTAYLKAHHPAAFMAANLSAVMDDTDKVRACMPGCAGRTASRCCRRTSTRRRTASSRSTRRRSAMAWAASRAPASRRSRASSQRASEAGRSATCSTSAARRQADRAIAAWSRRWSGPARSTRSTCGARRFRLGRHRDRGGGARRSGVGRPGEPVRRGRAGGRAVPYVKSPPLERRGAARAREGGARLLPLRASVRAYAAELAPLVNVARRTSSPGRTATLSPGSSLRCACRPAVAARWLS